MQFDIITLFPSMFSSVFNASIIQRAVKKGLIQINIHNLRDWATDKHKTVDDTPYGGGAGMVLKVDVMDRCLNEIVGVGFPRPGNDTAPMPKIILLTPQGKTFNQTKARKLSKLDRIILICGHYEGFDQRIRDHLVDEEISIGNYVLTGGEIPAMVLVDSISRLVPGVIKTESHQNESFSIRKQKKGRPPHLLEHPHYTKPAEYKGWKVPPVLLSGNHGEIEKWRKKKVYKS
ncbi:tRNA (guanosine(37)-N1)-methyltransferase TrmD [Patescibacteria group bacterium]|nr:tRNA (guanosine(37)-N1)-methyltransferase TrmD [Patescibacteria group bacterium]